MIPLTTLFFIGEVDASDSNENLFPSVVGGFFALVFFVIMYHCYLKRQQMKTPYNDELSGSLPDFSTKTDGVCIEDNVMLTK